MSSDFCVFVLFWRPEANLKGKTLRSNQIMVWKHGSILKIKTVSYISSFQQRNKSFAQTTIFLFFSVIFAFHHKMRVFDISIPFFDEAWNCSTDEVSPNGAWSGGLSAELYVKFPYFYSLLVCYPSRFTHCPLLFTCYSLLFTHYFLPVTRYFLLDTFYYLLITTYYLLVTTYSLLVTFYWFFLLVTRCYSYSVLITFHLYSIALRNN